jgi:uncharacterized membrane protein
MQMKQNKDHFPELVFNENLIWTRYVTIVLGIWLIITPLTFTTHDHLMFWSDIITGIILTILSFFSLRSERLWIPWVICLIGIWLEMAPLVFWANDGLTYLNDTIVGVFTITFSIIIPGTPGERIQHGIETPIGWSYNPSSWLQRIPIIFFGFVGWFIARYMAAYQLGYLDHVWDPVFGDNGTLKVITSNISRKFPISDAGLGAVAYTLEVLMGCKGSARRWYTMPWIVILFGILVVPLGLVSIILVILQPLLVGYWCFWCLLAAICMLIMIALTVDEVVAVMQYLAQVKRTKQPFWKVFWKGSNLPGPSDEDKLPSLNAPFTKMFPEMVKGFTTSWSLFISAIVGVWLMISSSIFATDSLVASNNTVFGALTVATSIITMAEVVRKARFLNLLFGIWIIIMPWILSGKTYGNQWSNLLAGILLIILSIPRGKILYQYGDWKA